MDSDFRRYSDEHGCHNTVLQLKRILARQTTLVVTSNKLALSWLLWLLCNYHSLTTLQMNIILEVEGGNELCISVGPFDTVRHVKETVQTLHHIPISLQNFFFNGQLVQDDLHIFTSQLFHGARIQLLLAPHQPPTITPSPPPTLPDYDNDPFRMLVPEIPTSFDFDQFVMPDFSSSTPIPQVPSNRTEFQKLPSPPPPPLPPPRVTLKVKVPKSKDRIPIEAELNDTVLKVKEKIGALEEMRGVAVDRIVLQSGSARAELLDHHVLKYCEVLENGDMDVFIKPCLAVGGGNKKVKVKVAPMRTKEKIEIEVNVLDRVAVLREELNKLQRRLGFPLPQQGCYFFIHRQQVMYEENSFQWHDVRQGDTIETFDGYISDNSSSSSSKPSSRPPR